MLGPLRELARTLLSFVLTRTRLAATELEDQAVRLVEILIWLALAMFFLGMALVFLAVLVVLLFWDSSRVLATSLIAILFLGGFGLTAWLAGVRMRERPPLLGQTLAELERDHETLSRP